MAKQTWVKRIKHDTELDNGEERLSMSLRDVW